MAPLSPKQLEVLAFIRRFIEERGLPPTRGEIAEGLGLKNRQGIDQHLRALEAKGVIELVSGISRGIRIREHTHALADNRGSHVFPDARRTPHASGHFFLPLLGKIAAGTPILAVENIEEHVHIDASLFKPRADFFLRISGDSMKDANILDRDLLAVHQSSQARDGQIIVARIDDEATVKYYERRGEIIHLKPANPDYSPIEVDLRRHEFTIEGLAVGVIRKEFNIAGTRAR